MAPMKSRPLRRFLAALALCLFGGFVTSDAAHADVPPQKKPDDDGCLAGGLPWVLPAVGVGIALAIRHRHQGPR